MTELEERAIKCANEYSARTKDLCIEDKIEFLFGLVGGLAAMVAMQGEHKEPIHAILERMKAEL